MADTGNSARIVFGKDAAATLKLPDQGNAMGTGIGSVEAKKTTVPDGSIMGVVGEAKVAPVKGDGFYFKDLNPPFGAVVGAQFLRTDDKNGAFLLNSATGKATIYDKAQADKLTALPLNAPTTAIASGSLVFPDTGQRFLQWQINQRGNLSFITIHIVYRREQYTDFISRGCGARNLDVWTSRECYDRAGHHYRPDCSSKRKRFLSARPGDIKHSASYRMPLILAA